MCSRKWGIFTLLPSSKELPCQKLIFSLFWNRDKMFIFPASFTSNARFLGENSLQMFSFCEWPGRQHSLSEYLQRQQKLKSRLKLSHPHCYHQTNVYLELIGQIKSIYWPSRSPFCQAVGLLVSSEFRSSLSWRRLNEDLHQLWRK